MGDYQIKTHMFTIYMCRCYIVLGVEWLCTLGLVTMDLKELYTSFTNDRHQHTLKYLQVGSP